MNVKSRILAVLTLACAVGGAAMLPAAAQQAGSTDAIIAGRQAAYDLMAGNGAAIKAAVDGGLAVKPYVAGAKGIVAWAHAIPGMFPAGTDKGHNTKALPAIWSDRAGFEKDAAALGTAADKLVVAANADDKAAFAAAFKETSEACGACHHDYRAR